ncbi:MAG: hypothetical protein ABGX05_09355 [Pirellulaceae bacterium]
MESFLSRNVYGTSQKTIDLAPIILASRLFDQHLLESSRDLQTMKK